MIRALVLLLTLFVAGCVAPGDRLSFPAHPVSASPEARSYDVDGDAHAEFTFRGENGRFNVLEYDDNNDGAADRRFRLSDYPPDSVPHLILLFDSIPFEPVVERFRRSGWTWFDPPVKVIPPFPTMSPVIFSRMMGAPPQHGAINQYYDRQTGRFVNRVLERTTGSTNPWERRLHYRLKYWENGLAFLEPRRWFHVDLARSKVAFDNSPDRVTLVYFASTACMLSKYGREGLEECLDGLEQLCMQVFYERRGAVKISMVADHGHTLVPGRRIDLADMLTSAGFRPTDRLRTNNDVVIEQDGLVNYAGIHTRNAADVASSLVSFQEIQLAMYMANDRVTVRSADGTATVEYRDGRYRYTPIDADVLNYQPVVESLRQAGKVHDDGFVDSEAWFHATVDHQWPDAPRRLWEAFHGIVVNTPDIMVTSSPGFYFGLPSFDLFVDMASTHGGFDQTDSATVLLTMTGRVARPIRTEEVIRTIEPTYDPSVLRR
jgi:hypothetical protein